MRRNEVEMFTNQHESRVRFQSRGVTFERPPKRMLREDVCYPEQPVRSCFSVFVSLPIFVDAPSWILHRYSDTFWIQFLKLSSVCNHWYIQQRSSPVSQGAPALFWMISVPISRTNAAYCTICIFVFWPAIGVPSPLSAGVPISRW